MFKWLLGIAAAMLMALVAAFAYLNAELVSLDFYFQTLELPVSVVAASAFAIGVVTSLVVYLPRVFLRNRKIARLQRQLNESGEELAKLRSVPMKGVE
ncbi:MAG: LapA family protein [Gammaproteobacteria bacterium]|nr:LapA family protein [Gammaproteobacteria bacterium]